MTIRVLALREGEESVLEAPVEALPALLLDETASVWVDLDDNGPDEERLLSEVFAFRHLVVEDVFEESQPKLEDHGDYVYLIFQGLAPGHREPHDVRTSELDLFLGPRFVLTHHPRPSDAVDAVRDRLLASGALLRRGPPFVAHAILDHMVDAFAPLMDRFEEAVEALELSAYAVPEERDVLAQVMDLKGSLQRIRRVGIHQREILRRLRSPGIGLIPDEARPFYGDIHDHFVRATDLADSLRDMTQAVLDTYMSVQSHRMNEVVKVLTVISTIMLPLTFLAGVWGMNFRHMPELEWPHGYAFAWGSMLTVAVGLLWLFKRRGWI